MDRGRVPGEAAASEQRMRGAVTGRRDTPGEAVFRTARILADVSAGDRRGDLHAPARAEHRQAGLQRRAHQVKLAPHRRPVLGEPEGRAGEHHAVECLETESGNRIGVGGVDQRADRRGREVGHHGGEGLRGGPADGVRAVGATVAVVAVGDQKAQHRVGHEGSRRSGKTGRGAASARSGPAGRGRRSPQGDPPQIRLRPTTPTATASPAAANAASTPQAGKAAETPSPKAV